MLQLNYRDSKPIYEQVKDGIRKLVITGALLPEEKIPSVREMASKLAINPNTIAKAYKELEDEGYIYTKSGRGSFVSARIEMGDQRTNELLDQFDEVVEELLYLSIKESELKKRIDQVAERGSEV